MRRQIFDYNDVTVLLDDTGHLLHVVPTGVEPSADPDAQLGAPFIANDPAQPAPLKFTEGGLYVVEAEWDLAITADVAGQVSIWNNVALAVGGWGGSGT